MKIQKNEAHIWYFNTTDVSGKMEYFKSLLSKEEIQRANKFKFEKDRQISIHTRGLLRLISTYYIDNQKHKIVFKYNKYGKPTYDFSTSMRFNISHSGHGIVLAFSKDGEIGVDIEFIKGGFDVISISQNFFSKEERDALGKVPKEEQLSAFYKIWTRKESFIKAKGSGLSFPLAAFTVSLSDNQVALLKTEWNTSEKDEWNLFSFKPEKNYIGALTVPKIIQKVNYFGLGDIKI